MRFTWLLLTVSLMLVAFGCSAPPPPQKSAAATKQQVLEFVKKTKENLRSKSVADDAAVFLEGLRSNQAKAADDGNGALYDDLCQKCKQVVETARNSPGSQEVAKKLDELAEIANKLPD
jgi:transcription initiation factor IIE alpha subunit